MYSDYEEKYGLISHSLEVLDRAIKEITDPDCQLELVNLYLSKTT